MGKTTNEAKKTGVNYVPIPPSKPSQNKQVECCDVKESYCPSVKTSEFILDEKGELHCQCGPHVGKKDKDGSGVGHHQPFTTVQIDAIKEENAIKDKKGETVGYISDDPKQESIVRGYISKQTFELTKGRVKGKGIPENKDAPELDHIKPWKEKDGCNSFRNAKLISNKLNNFKRSTWPWDDDALIKKMHDSNNKILNDTFHDVMEQMYKILKI